jgi:hypothetical protein
MTRRVDCVAGGVCVCARAACGLCGNDALGHRGLPGAPSRAPLGGAAAQGTEGCNRLRPMIALAWDPPRHTYCSHTYCSRTPWDGRRRVSQLVIERLKQSPSLAELVVRQRDFEGMDEDEEEDEDEPPPLVPLTDKMRMLLDIDHPLHLKITNHDILVFTDFAAKVSSPALEPHQPWPTALSAHHPWALTILGPSPALGHRLGRSSTRTPPPPRASILLRAQSASPSCSTRRPCALWRRTLRRRSN